eukprot:8969345-Heterocapsa_arctica.AAC.1
MDFEQQLFSEDDDGGFPKEPAALPDAVGPRSAAQQCRRVQGDAGHWPARRGSSRPPYVHPEMWQTLSADVRRELAAEH